MTFEDWKSEFCTSAAKTILPKTVAQCAAFMQQLPSSVDADTKQPEARKTLWQYLSTAVSQTRIENGQQALRTHDPVFDTIEDRFDVDRHIVAAIWGMETNYGAIRGDVNVFAALATMAHQGRRRTLFEAQLLAACQIVEKGICTPDQMIGSWAGAMGHTQFMPTSYLDFAMGLTQEMANIWDDDPSDALASAAHYLKRHGWVPNTPWAIEVEWPQTLDLFKARHHTPQTVHAWCDWGITPIHDTSSAANFEFHLPAGHKGPAFLISQNYRAILKYNNADAYAVGIGHLADRLSGGKALTTDWTGDDRGLTLAEVQTCQNLLTELGFDTQGADGFTGPNTVRATEAFQRDHGLPVDGHLDLEMLDRLTQQCK